MSRLQDWFRVLHANGNHERARTPEKSRECPPSPQAGRAAPRGLSLPNPPCLTPPSPSPAEAEAGVSPRCKEPLGWMFSRLDTNFDLQLDQSEIKSLYLDKKEPCSDPFFKSCDTRADSLISSTEWCTCFQRYTGTTLPKLQVYIQLLSMKAVSLLCAHRQNSSALCSHVKLHPSLVAKSESK